MAAELGKAYDLQRALRDGLVPGVSSASDPQRTGTGDRLASGLGVVAAADPAGELQRTQRNPVFPCGPINPWSANGPAAAPSP
jgi:hypothetical protein